MGASVNLDELRKVVRSSFEVVTYKPNPSSNWAVAQAKFNGLNKS